MNKKIAAFIALTAILPTALTGCDFSLSSLPFFESSSDSGSGANLSISIPSNPENLDPQTATDTESRTIISNIFEGLTKLNEKGETELGVASSYTVSDDNLTYTFKIRSDAKWFFDANDDDYMDDDEFTQVTADDFVFAFQRIFNPQTESPYKETFSFLENAKEIIAGSKDYTEIGVYAEDDETVVFKLAETQTYFLDLLASSSAKPCQEEFFYSTKGRYGLDDSSINSNGPFYVQQWYYDEYGNNNFMYIRRNSEYSSKQTVSPKLITVNIRKSEEEVEEDYSDENSCLYITDDYSSRYINSKSQNVTGYQYATLGLIFNSDVSALKNTKFKKALRLAVDTSTVADEAGTEDILADGIIPPAITVLGRSYRELYSEDKLSVNQNIDEAKKLYSEALNELNTENIETMKILVCSESINCSYLHCLIEQWQENLGFYATIDEVSKDDFETRLSENNYQIALYELTADSNSPEDILCQFVEDDNVFGCNSSELNEKFNEVQEQANLSDCIDLYGDIEQYIIDSGYFYPLFYKSAYTVTTSNVSDVVYNPFNGQTYWQYIKSFS